MKIPTYGAIGLLVSVGLLLVSCSASSASMSGDNNLDAKSPSNPVVSGLLNHPGKLWASNCFQCHGTDGKNGAFDSLAGESASEIVGEMREMKTSNEADKAIMKVHALGYSDAQIQQIADYFSKVPR